MCGLRPHCDVFGLFWWVILCTPVIKLSHLKYTTEYTMVTFYAVFFFLIVDFVWCAPVGCRRCWNDHTGYCCSRGTLWLSCLTMERSIPDNGELSVVITYWGYSPCKGNPPYKWSCTCTAGKQGDILWLLGGKYLNQCTRLAICVGDFLVWNTVIL